MNLVMQILLINLVISCENVDVFALATNGSPPDTARNVHRVGVGLSLVFKIIFIAIASTLFAIPWLHIRIIGGVILLYVTFNMLLHGKETPNKRLKSKNSERDSLFETIISMTRLVERFSIFNNLCAGYLTYMAIKMIFEDDTIKPFFERINFTFAIPGVALCGILHSNLFAVLCINSPDCIFCKSKGFIAVNKKYLLKKL